MSRIPVLAQLASQTGQDPEVALQRVLGLLCEQLGMTIAVVGDLSGDEHRVHVAVDASGRRLPELEGARPASLSWCGQLPDRKVMLVSDAADEPVLSQLEVTRALGIGCYAGVLLPAGAGSPDARTLGVVGQARHEGLDARDLAVLEGLGEVVSDLLDALDRRRLRHLVPSQRTAPDLSTVADIATSATDLEGLARPLLDVLHQISGMSATYLTTVHEDEDRQLIRYALNSRTDFAVPEGLYVPWADTLCRRALDSGTTCTLDAQGLWPDAPAGRDLGIVTYFSVPVRLTDGRVWGTLCGADDVAVLDASTHLPTLTLFARLIAAEVERAAVVDQERARAVQARHEADTDELTGCSTRRTVQPWLEHRYEGLGDDEVVALAFVDVNCFKLVNDRYGHGTGDGLLTALGLRLLGTARAGDLVARIGGDEFVVAAVLPAQALPSFTDRVRAAAEFSLASEHGDLPVHCAVGVATSQQAADPAALLAQADAGMYRDKAVGAQR